MSVRALDSSGDWTFGAGLNNYKVNNLEVAQNIQTRLNSFLGDCFFDVNAGINWWGFLGSKDQLGLSLAISTVILNTAYVQQINQLSVTLSSNRVFSISYSVFTSYSTTINQEIQVGI